LFSARALCAALAAAGTALAAEQAPVAPPEAEPAEQLGDVRYRADLWTYRPDSKTVLLEGHVVIERGDGRISASRGVLDREKGTLHLEGGVLAVQGLQVAVADAALIDLRSNAADLSAATVFLKDRRALPQLAGLLDSSAARTTGRNQLTLHGTSVVKLPDGSLSARSVSLTPCDCAGPPDYQVWSPELHIEKERAQLRWPVVEIFSLPIPVLIPVSLPLTDRQSGLLAPRFGFATTSGFGIVEPAFFTLGRSWDVTVAPGWFTGASTPTPPAAPPPDFSALIGNRTVRGPRLDLELRGAPANGVALKAELDLLQDLDQDQSVASPPGPFGTPPNGAGRGFGGLRGVLRTAARADASWGTAALEGATASDAMIIADTQPTVLERLLDSLRTDAGVWGRAGPAVLGADVTLLQDLRINPSFPDRRLFGDEARHTFQRLPGAFAQLPGLSVAGPLWLSGEASVTHFTALRGSDSQEIQTGFGPTDLLGTAPQLVATPVADPQGLARAAGTRLDVSPRLQATLVSGPLGSVSAMAGARADAWWFEGDSQRDRRRLYALGGLRAETQLSRAYASWVHTLTPSVEVRALSPALAGGGPPIGDPTDGGGLTYATLPNAAQQGVPPGVSFRDGPDCTNQTPAACTVGVPAARRAYDELDGAAPERGAGQAVLRLDQALWIPGGPGRLPVRALELTLAQDALLWVGGGRPRMGEAWMLARGAIGPVQLAGRANWDWGLRELSGGAASATLSDARGDQLRASVQALHATAASELIRAGADELFSTARLASTSGSLTGSAGAGVTVKLPTERPPVTLAYGYEHHLGELFPGTPDTVHHLGASVETACRCAGVQLALDLPYLAGTRQPISFRLLLDLKSLGTFGSP
jgi:LPS-assembly protein